MQVALKHNDKVKKGFEQETPKKRRSISHLLEVEAEPTESETLKD